MTKSGTRNSFAVTSRAARKLNVTAPKIYYELSGYDVIVSEFVRGIWVSEMMARIDLRGQELR